VQSLTLHSLKITHSGDDRSVLVYSQVAYRKAFHRYSYSHEAYQIRSQHSGHQQGDPEEEWAHRQSSSPLEILEYVQRVLSVFQDLRDAQRDDYTGLTSDSIPLTILRRRHKKLIENPNWTLRDANWGEHRRIFTDAEEATITDVTRENYITLHRLFTNEDFITLTVDYWLMKFADGEKPPLFNCSPGFIRAFTNRNRFSSPRQHFKRHRKYRKKHNPDGEFCCPFSSRHSATIASSIATRLCGGLIITVS
jgi:hypothetical protein